MSVKGALRANSAATKRGAAPHPHGSSSDADGTHPCPDLPFLDASRAAGGGRVNAPPLRVGLVAGRACPHVCQGQGLSAGCKARTCTCAMTSMSWSVAARSPSSARSPTTPPPSTPLLREERASRGWPLARALCGEKSEHAPPVLGANALRRATPAKCAPDANLRQRPESRHSKWSPAVGGWDEQV